MSRWHARLAELRASRNEAITAVQIVQNVQNSPAAPTFEHFEHIEQRTEPARSPVASSDADERAAFIGYDGGAPREWTEAIARLDAARPPADVLPQRWLQFIDDCGRFLDDGWAERAAALGWGPLDLFGCNRERPYARIDHMGLLWFVNGARIAELHRDRAIIEKPGGARLTFRRCPVEAGRVVLAWELADAAPVCGPPQDAPTPEDRTCVHCRGAIDGTEQLCGVGGVEGTVWLHPQCQRPYVAGLPPLNAVRAATAVPGATGIAAPSPASQRK